MRSQHYANCSSVSYSSNYSYVAVPDEPVFRELRKVKLCSYQSEKSGEVSEIELICVERYIARSRNVPVMSPYGLSLLCYFVHSYTILTEFKHFSQPKSI